MASLWDRALSLVHQEQQPASLNDQILELLTKHSTASYTTVGLLLLSILFLAYKTLMGDRNSFGYWGGGRASPFLSNLADSAPRDLSSHFEYIGPDDELYSKHRPSVAAFDPDSIPEAPDRIHVKYMDKMIPVNFPAYSINEATTYVGDLRKAIAHELRVDPSRVRLIYKRHELKQNRYPLKRYGMKQNSEVSAIVTERSTEYNRSDSLSASGSDSEPAAPPPRRPRAQSTVRLRSEEQLPTVARHTGPHLHPNGHVSSTGPRDSGRPTERVPPREREPSRNRGPSPGPAHSANNLPRADPDSPLGKVQALASAFHTQWLPPATRFLLSPPSDPDAKRKEFLKLTEGILNQIVIKADGIESEGNADARNLRKSLVNEANSVLSQLDNVVKKS